VSRPRRQQKRVDRRAEASGAGLGSSAAPVPVVRRRAERRGRNRGAHFGTERSSPRPAAPSKLSHPGGELPGFAAEDRGEADQFPGASVPRGAGRRPRFSRALREGGAAGERSPCAEVPQRWRISSWRPAAGRDVVERGSSTVEAHCVAPARRAISATHGQTTRAGSARRRQRQQVAPGHQVREHHERDDQEAPMPSRRRRPAAAAGRLRRP
jgi:hypothetical protein